MNIPEGFVLVPVEPTDELAKRMGLTHTWVSALANKPKASTATIEALASQFGMKVSDFVRLGED